MTEAQYQGLHILIDMHGARELGSATFIESALRDAALAAGATILDSVFHHFGPGLGVTGVVVLAESHASIHSWPERDYAAIDLFLCGAANNPDAAISLLKARFVPAQMEERRISRGYGATD